MMTFGSSMATALIGILAIGCASASEPAERAPVSAVDGARAFEALLAQTETRALKEPEAIKGLKVLEVTKGLRAPLVLKVLKVQKVLEAIKVTKALRVLKVLKV